MRLNFLYQCSIYDYYCRNMWYSKGTQVAPFTIEQLLPWSDFIKERCLGVTDTETIRPENREDLPV